MSVNWSDFAVLELQAGRNVTITPKGNSMTPKIKSGARVTLEPINSSLLLKGDIVLVSIGKTIYLHLISALEKDRVQISNNHGYVNGWTSKNKVYGKVVKIDNA
jgi:phage repressor protein C with HTH and peptisase S24 domain